MESRADWRRSGGDEKYRCLTIGQEMKLALYVRGRIARGTARVRVEVTSTAKHRVSI